MRRCGGKCERVMREYLFETPFYTLFLAHHAPLCNRLGCGPWGSSRPAQKPASVSEAVGRHLDLRMLLTLKIARCVQSYTPTQARSVRGGACELISGF